MLQKKLIGALLAVLGGASASAAVAGRRIDVHAGQLGRVTPTSLASHLGLGSGSAYRGQAYVRTAHRTTKTREQQMFRGVPVYGRHLVVERDRAGNVIDAQGAAEQNVAADLASVRPQLSASQARLKLQAALGHRSLSISNGHGELFVYPQAGGKSRLVYRTSYLVTVRGHLSRPTAIVDANTGAVLRHWEGLTDGRRGSGSPTPTNELVNGVGGNDVTGSYFYDNSGPGRESLPVQRVGNVCYMQNDHVATYNLAGSQGQRVTLWSFGCSGSDSSRWLSSGDAINGAMSPINDAHHFGGVVYDMYNNWFGEPPLHNGDGSPMQLVMMAHYGSNYENAFWDGSEMVFGDGDQYFYPFVVLDITGHEISHGFTEQHAGLEYNGQSGGMNEAFSDMAGEAVKFYDRGRNDFMVGSEIVKPDTVPLLGMAALRDMCRPSADGASIDDASGYYDGLDVHYSSGVYNRAFCTLATSSGWDTRMAFEVFHDANAVYWTPTETFDSGACGVEQAATDRGYSEADVEAAFTHGRRDLPSSHTLTASACRARGGRISGAGETTARAHSHFE